MLLFLKHDSQIRRGSAAILVKNICFVSTDNHWLLGPSVDILPALLLPLAGGPEVANLDMDRVRTVGRLISSNFAEKWVIEK